MSTVEQEYRKVQADLNTVGKDLATYAKETKQEYKEISGKQGELSARLLNVEQIVASNDSKHAGVFVGNSKTIEVVNELRESQPFANLKAGNHGTARANLPTSIKAALSNSDYANSDFTTFPSRPESGGIVAPVMRPLTLLDVIPSRPVANDSVEFVQITATGEAGTQEEEGDEKAEISFDGTPKKAYIATIAGHTTASKQVLQDQAQLTSTVDFVLKGKARSKLEYQLINGAGGADRIDGFLNQATEFTPTVSGTNIDMVGEALATMRDSGYSPNLIILNPLDWFAMTISKNEEGDYLLGSPVNPVPPAAWNAAVVQSSSIERGQALVIDTAHVTLLDREQVSVMLSNSHKDYFTRNLVLALGELRAGLEIRDTGAVLSVSLDEASQ